MQPVLRTAAVEEGDGVSLLSSLPPHVETSHENNVTACVLLHRTAMGAWEQDTSVYAAQTLSPTSSVNLSVLLPVQTPKL